MKKRILFVDDDPLVLAGLRNVFYRERARWDIAVARGGERALELLGSTTFDIVVCDMRMPVVDGSHVFRVLERDSPMTKRVMLSGSADEDELKQARAAVHELLNKPCDSATLRESIERLLAA